MAKRTLEEIIEALDSDTVRTALTQQKARVQTMIAERVVELQAEMSNPTTNDEVKAEIERLLTKQIIGLQEMKEGIEERLSDSDGILKGLMPNRAAKRRAAKNGAKEAKTD